MALTVAIVALSASAASADTFCVMSPPGCSGTAETNVTNALTDAAGTAGSDEIQIAGNHTYSHSANLVDAPGNIVSLVGVNISGAQPVITETSPALAGLIVQEPQSSVHNLGFLIPAGTNDTGLVLQGASGDGINVTGPSATSGASGVELQNGAALSNANIAVAHSAAVFSNGVDVNGAATITDTSIDADRTIRDLAGSGNLTVRRIVSTAPAGILVRNTPPDDAVIEDSLLVPTGPAQGALSTRGIDAEGAVSITARNLTIVYGGGGNAAATSAGMFAANNGGAPSVSVDSSIVRGFDEDLMASGSAVSIGTDYDDWHSSQSLLGAPAIVRGTHDLDVTPGFVGGGDRHLASGSPLIDMGNPTPPGPLQLDLDGNARALPGPGSCVARRDIGSYEFVAPPLDCNPPGPPDVTAPDTGIQGKAKVKTRKKRVKKSYTLTSTEAGSSFQCSLDGAPFTPCSSPLTERLRRGRHTLEARAVDAAGNVDGSPAVLNIRVKRKKH